MMCPNCGEGYKLCGCTWEEKVQASRIKEARRREHLAREGRPVEVDHTRGKP